MITRLNLYYIDRPFSYPSGFNVIAKDKKEAIIMSNKNFGFCHNTTAKKVMFERGILLQDSPTIGMEKDKEIVKFED